MRFNSAFKGLNVKVRGADKYWQRIVSVDNREQVQQCCVWHKGNIRKGKERKGKERKGI
jgi:hypothetical protein